jgi:hypothetical protein
MRRETDFSAFILLKNPSGVHDKTAAFSSATRIAANCGAYFTRLRVFSYHTPDNSYIFYLCARHSAANQLEPEAKWKM